MHAALVSQDGCGIRVPRDGLWIGRSLFTDLVVDDHRVSQIHALVTLRVGVLHILPMGRNPTRLNGRPLEGRTELTNGDRIEVPGGAWTVQISGRLHTTNWAVVLPQGSRVGLSDRDVRIGGGPTDDVHLPSWPPASLQIHRPTSGVFIVEALVDLQINGETWQAGVLDEVPSGTTVQVGLHDPLVFVEMAPAGAQTTMLDQDASLPVRVDLHFTATGGELTLAWTNGTVCRIDLPELRARLLARLLLDPGEEVEDPDLLSAVWPGHPDRGRLDLNQLVHRCRKLLLAAGVNATGLLVRPRRGGAAQFRVARGAKVTVD